MPSQTQGYTQGDFLNRCDLMRAGAEANPGVPGIQELLFPFATAIENAKKAQQERALHRADAQQSSRDLDESLVTCSDIYSRMRRLIQAAYGTHAEKLAEFGLLPLRPARKAKPNPQSPENAQPGTGAATPAADSIH